MSVVWVLLAIAVFIVAVGALTIRQALRDRSRYIDSATWAEARWREHEREGRADT